MFKSLLSLLAVAAILAGGYYVFVENAPIKWKTLATTGEIAAQKCVSSDDKVYYGDVPEGIDCFEQVAIAQNLTIVPARQSVTSNSSGRGSGSFSCDGRTYCSQMRSCEEATYFLNSCPGTKMDGNGDGVPCEQQWCR